MKAITILTALYRAGPYLESKLLSLEQQTIFADCQVLMLNCLNLDRESDLVGEFCRRHPNTHQLLYREEVTLYQSWNDGIRLTASPYLTNFNVDDQTHPEYLERCVRHLEQDPGTAVVSSQILVTDQPNQLWPRWTHRDRLPAYPYPLSTAGPCPVWRRRLHDRYGPFNGRYRVIGDARIWERWHAGGESFSVIPEDLVLYYLNPVSLERRQDETGLYRDQDLRL